MQRRVVSILTVCMSAHEFTSAILVMKRNEIPLTEGWKEGKWEKEKSETAIRKLIFPLTLTLTVCLQQTPFTLLTIISSSHTHSGKQKTKNHFFLISSTHTSSLIAQSFLVHAHFFEAQSRPHTRDLLPAHSLFSLRARIFPSLFTLSSAASLTPDCSSLRSVHLLFHFGASSAFFAMREDAAVVFRCSHFLFVTANTRFEYLEIRTVRVTNHTHSHVMNHLIDQSIWHRKL